jgi:hypothetical protein
MFQSFAVVPAGKAHGTGKRDRVGFDKSLRTNSKFDAKYLRASAVHTRTAVWAAPTGEVKLVKVGPRKPTMATKLAALQDMFNR